MRLQKHISLRVDKRETNRRNCVCWEPSSVGKGGLWGSISSAPLTFFIKPHCIIMARVSGILHCCLISQLMLLLSAANPSFVLLKKPLSFHYHGEIEFVIYCKERVCSGYVRRLLNLNKLQFWLCHVLMACNSGVFIPVPRSVRSSYTVRGLQHAKHVFVLNRSVTQELQSPISFLWHFICDFS